jgi:hypothetical protein
MGQSLMQELVGQEARLFEDVHSFMYLNVTQPNVDIARKLYLVMLSSEIKER